MPGSLPILVDVGGTSQVSNVTTTTEVTEQRVETSVTIDADLATFNATEASRKEWAFHSCTKNKSELTTLHSTCL